MLDPGSWPHWELGDVQVNFVCSCSVGFMLGLLSLFPMACKTSQRSGYYSVMLSLKHNVVFGVLHLLAVDPAIL